jgi:hypothetical protein
MMFLILLIILIIQSVTSTPLIIKDGCPKANPEYKAEEYEGCPTDWILEVCPCCDNYCTSRTPTPTKCNIRSPTCKGESTNTPSGTPTGELILPTSSPTFITTVVETVVNRLTNEPTAVTSSSPSSSPSESPSESPSRSPSSSPSDSPSDSPSEYPTWIATSKERCPLSVYTNDP